MFWVKVIVSPAAAVLRALMSAALFATSMFPAKAGSAKTAAPAPSRRASVNREAAPRRARARTRAAASFENVFWFAEALAPPTARPLAIVFPSACPRARAGSRQKIRATPRRPMTPNNGGHGTPGSPIASHKSRGFSPSPTPRFFNLHVFWESDSPLRKPPPRTPSLLTRRNICTLTLGTRGFGRRLEKTLVRGCASPFGWARRSPGERPPVAEEAAGGTVVGQHRRPDHARSARPAQAARRCRPCRSRPNPGRRC